MKQSWSIWRVALVGACVGAGYVAATRASGSPGAGHLVGLAIGGAAGGAFLGALVAVLRNAVAGRG
jgi:hypothetical protein